MKSNVVTNPRYSSAISDEAGMELLKHLDVKGTDDEIKQAV